MSRSDVIDINVHLHHETDKAVLVSDTGDKDDAVWLPKSQIEIEPDAATHVVSLPEWLAIEKELA